MSVQTQIDRISGNVSAALSAIAEKGVTVPDGSTSDTLAELIQAIQAGGAYKVCAGSFTTTGYSTYTYTVIHDMGMVPRVCVWAQRPTTTGVKGALCIAAAYDRLQGAVGFNVSNAYYTKDVIGFVGNYAVTIDDAGFPIYKATETQVSFRKCGAYFAAGTYDYILIGW